MPPISMSGARFQGLRMHFTQALCFLSDNEAQRRLWCFKIYGLFGHTYNLSLDGGVQHITLQGGAVLSHTHSSLGLRTQESSMFSVSLLQPASHPAWCSLPPSFFFLVTTNPEKLFSSNLNNSGSACAFNAVFYC